MLGIAALGAQGAVFHPVSVAATDGAEQGVYYTAATDAAGQVVVIEEPTRTDRSKVLLTLINLTDGPVRLMLDAQDATVIDPTPVNAAAGRAVNPVSARLSVIAQDAALLGTFDVQLRRGQNVTFVARPEGATLIENRFGPNLGD